MSSMPPTPPANPLELKVIPAGGKFKVRYTKTARHYEEPLEKALEDLNAVLFFGPGTKLQQTDIRLVALDRRSYALLGEIQNLHKVEAADVEAFILRYAASEAGSPAPAAAAPGPSARHAPEAIGFKVHKTKGNTHFTLVLLLSDGREDHQHFLTHATIKTLRDAGAFDERFDIHQSATNDRLMAFLKGAHDNKPVETVALEAGSEAEAALTSQRAQDFLNQYRRARTEGAAPTPAVSPPPVSGPAASPVTEPLPAPAVPPGSRLPAPASPAAEENKATVSGPRPLPPPAKLGPVQTLFDQVARLSPESKHAAAFAALELCLEVTPGIKSVPVENNYTLLSLGGEERLGPQFTGFVLSAKRSLAFCRQETTVRFGLDHTLLENGKTAEVWKFPAPALLGIHWWWDKDWHKIGGFTFIVASNFLKGVPAGLRLALKQSGILFAGPDDLGEKAESPGLIWPSSREDTLFYKTALGLRENFRDAKGADVFPLSPATINLSPGQPTFVGFKRTKRHGIVYQADEDYFARFEPDELEITAAGYAFAGSVGLAGFAFDGSMRMCALHDPAQAGPGFVPPENKLIRFVSLENLELEMRAGQGFTCLGLLPFE
jgi:hypothetical protein